MLYSTLANVSSTLSLINSLITAFQGNANGGVAGYVIQSIVVNTPVDANGQSHAIAFNLDQKGTDYDVSLT